MRNLRRYSLDAASAFEIQLAADARMSRTDYADDQAWSVELGVGDRAALAYQTRYGGRAGLVSLAPMWRVGDRQIYQERQYAEAPFVAHFAPNFLRVQAQITAQLRLVANFWVMESRAAGGEFNLTNDGSESLQVQLELFGHVATNDRARKLNVLTLGDYSLALHLGQIGRLNPVVTLEGASHDIYGGRISSPKLGLKLSLAPGQSARVPFVTAAFNEITDSHSVAMNWMSRPWTPYFERIDREAAAVPRIYTGNDSWDLTLDYSYALLLKSIMQGRDQLPQASFVANRVTNRGWSRRGDGTDHIRAWSGQDPALAHLIAPALASIDPEIATGIIRNYLATQDVSGFVDRQPGLAGQRQGLLMMPLLARLTWQVYVQTEDETFLAEAFPKLLSFFERWLHDDHDADGDGAPEWQSERQTGYVAFPTFGTGQGWAQGADIRQMETPDLLAYLISESEALVAMARVLKSDALDGLQKRLEQLGAQLEEFWNGSRYCYRDRDSHQTSEGIELLYGGAGDQLHTIARELSPANRVAIRIVGGVSQRPRIRLRLIGRDEHGADCRIEADVDEILWHNRQGAYISDRPLSFVDSIEVDGLSRVYKVHAQTIDCGRLDINHLLPLVTGALPEKRAKALVELAMDEKHFWRTNGLTMVSAADRNFDPSNGRGGGGLWIYWLSLIGEGMVKSGFRREATQLVKRVLESLSQILKRDGFLSQFYHADEYQGFGEDHHVGGIVPLGLLHEVIGVRIVSSSKAWVGGDFTWAEPIRIEQHGVRVERDADGIRVEFPSGHSETLPANIEWRALVDPTAPPATEEAAPESRLPESPLPPDEADDSNVVIRLDAEPSSDTTETAAEDDIGDGDVEDVDAAEPDDRQS